MNSSLRDKRVKLILKILELSEEEGEDILLSEILKHVGNERELVNELKQFEALPPRIVISKLLYEPKWKTSIRMASEIYLQKRYNQQVS